MEDLTTGSISRHLLKTTSFMLVTMVFQTLYFLVDLYWVGRLGKEAIAGVGIAGNLTFIVLAITQMLAVGTTTLISHAAGRKEREQAQQVLTQSLLLAAFIGALFLIVVTALRESYVGSLSPDSVSAAAANSYLSWFIPAMALQFPMVVMAAALRGTGNFKPGMVVQTATVIINIVLAPALMFGWIGTPQMGVAGAGLASFVAIIVGTIWLAYYFFDAASYLKLHPHFKPNASTWAQVLKIGLPAGVEFAFIAVYLFVVYTVSRPFGAAAQAGFGIGQRITQAGFMPVVALGFAVAPVAGQNFGARKADRVLETFKRAALMAASIMALFTIPCVFAGEAMIRFFSSDPAVIAVGAEYLRLISWSLAAGGVVFVNGSIFQAMGNTIPPLIASFVRILVVAIPAILLSRMAGFELRWIWYLSVAATMMQLTMNLLLLRRELRIRLAFQSSAFDAASAAVARQCLCLLRRLRCGLSIAATHIIQGDGHALRRAQGLQIRCRSDGRRFGRGCNGRNTRRAVLDDGQPRPSGQRAERAAELAHDERGLRVHQIFEALADQPGQCERPADGLGAGARRDAGRRTERPRKRAESAHRQWVHVHQRRLGHALQDRRAQRRKRRARLGDRSGRCSTRATSRARAASRCGKTSSSRTSPTDA